MSIATIITLMQKTMGFEDNGVLAAIRFIGEAATAMLISLLFAVYTMGLARKIPMKDSYGFLYISDLAYWNDALNHWGRRSLQTSID